MEVTKTSELAKSETPLYQPTHACARYGVVKIVKSSHGRELSSVVYSLPKLPYLCGYISETHRNQSFLIGST
jgi:hypothetical protein